METVITQPVNKMRRTIDRFLCPPMVWLSMFFLTLVAIVIAQLERHHIPQDLVIYSMFTLITIWPIFWLEFAYRQIILHRHHRTTRRLMFGFAVCLIPPLRIILKPATARKMVFIPIIGWTRMGRKSLKRLEKLFSVPMMTIALMILPVLAIELIWQDQYKNHHWLALILDVATRIIWLAFAIEFVVLLSVARNKLSFCIKHWIDLAIILLPFVAFLRVLRLGPLIRTMRVGKLARVYRMRGLAMRGLRALMLLNIIARLSTWSAEKRIHSLHTAIKRKKEEIEDLEEEINSIEQNLIQQKKDKA